LLFLWGLQLLWSGHWYFELERRHQAQLQNLAHLLGAEVQLGLETNPFHPGPLLNRLCLLPELDGAQLRGADNAPLWSQGHLDPRPLSYPINERGQHLASLHLSFRSEGPPLVLFLGWLGVLGLTLALLRRPRREGLSRSLILELDDQRRVLRLSGHTQLLASSQNELLGQSLDDLLAGQRGARTYSELGGSQRRSLVVVRDSQDLEKVRLRLKALEAQYRNLCDFAHDLILVAEPEGVLVYGNRALRRVVGESDPLKLDQLFSPTSQELARQALHSSLLGTPARPFEAELLASDGRLVPVMGTFCASTPQDKTPLTVLGIFQDLSKQRQIEDNLRQAQKMEAVGLLASGVAHDFNNLLTIFAGLSSLIRCEVDNPDEVVTHLDELDSTVARASDLTRQLLHFSRKKKRVYEELELDQEVAQIVKLSRRLVGSHVEISTHLQSEATLLADRSELEQVVMNLIINARDAMPQGGHIRLSTRLNGDCAQLTVSDTGCGIPAEVLARIFEPYFTTKEPGKGTGLGLSTAYAVVTRWGGQIEVASQPGQGTTFTVSIPLQTREPGCTP